MPLIPFGLRAALSPDRDVRRMYWLLRRATLQPAHRLALATIEQRLRARTFRAWARTGDRETIRVLFNLYRVGRGTSGIANARHIV